MLIDTHCHLFLKDFCDDLEAVKKRAEASGISKIILPNIDSSTIESMFSLYNKYPDFCYPTLGIHPSSIKDNYKKELSRCFSNNFDNIAAIGEIGIDLYWDKTFFKEQENAFIYQLEIAKERNLPIIIHSRSSMNEILLILKKLKFHMLRGVFHCFSGSYEQAKKIIDMGFYLGIGGVITFKNSGLQKVVEKIPLEYILLETDAPYLSPTPYRGTRNEPAYIKEIAEKIAEIKAISFDDVAIQTSKNARFLCLD